MTKKKTLYEVLEVAQSASPETIEASYRSLCARLNVRHGRDPEAAAIARTAVEEAYRTLSSEPLRRTYDARLAPSPASAQTPFAERPWYSRHAALLVVIAVALVAGHLYHQRAEKERAERERAEVARRLEEKERLLARQEADREAARRAAAEAEAERQRRMEEARYQLWLDQARRSSASHARAQEYESSRAERESAHQRYLEETTRRQEEAQARARLEQDKQRLRQLELQNYGYRRY